MIDIHCTSCHRPYPEDGVPYRCASCGGVFGFTKPPIFDQVQELKDLPGIWRYQSMFNLPDYAPVVSLGEGNTPLIWTDLLGYKVALKLDYLNPTGSFKDRGSAVLVSFLKSRGVTSAVEDSSGNAGASFAAYAARAGIKARVFVPDSASGPKKAQIEAYGAEVVNVIGPRSNAADAVRRSVEKGNVYASHAFLPQGLFGYATLAYEIRDQLGREPGTVICPVGQGNLLLGIGIGFEAIQQAGLIAKMPILVGVQAQACAPFWALSSLGPASVDVIVEGDTVAEGIRVKNPVRGDILYQFVRDHDGLFIAVDEESIVSGYEDLGRKGFFVEPTAAVVYPALFQVVGKIREPIVIVLTGSGLKVNFLH